MSADLQRLLALAERDPATFSRLLDSVEKVTVKLHEGGQKDVFYNPARFKVLNCGRRWGKTILAAKTLLSKARKSRQMLWWVAPTYKIAKRGYEEVLRQMPDGVLAKPAPPSTNFDAGRSVILHFKNGTKMEFYSAERPEGMLGAAVDFVVIDEAARMRGSIWNETISPTLMDHLGGALIISTPRGRNWFYQVYQKGQDAKQTDWASWTFISSDNPTLPEGEVERMAEDMPQLEADQELYAKWLAAGSAVFMIPEASIQRRPDGKPPRLTSEHLVQGMPPHGFVVLGVDLARTSDWTVLYGANSHNRRNCYFERFQDVSWPEQKRRIRRAVRTLKRHGAEDVLIMVDSTGVGDPIYEDLSNDGFDVVGINFTTHKQNMVRLLAKDVETSAAFLLPNRLNEFEEYMLEQTESGRFKYHAPEGAGMHDDAVAAKMLQHWGIINEAIGDITVLSTDPLPQAAPSGGRSDDEADPELDEDDYSDWIDPDLDLDLTDEEADQAIGVESPAELHARLLRPPSPQELLQRGIGFM